MILREKALPEVKPVEVLPAESVVKPEELAVCSPTEKRGNTENTYSRSSQRKTVPAAIKSYVFKRDQCCQWRDRVTQKLCGSKFQLQLDHRRPVWAGGGSETENLQLLCGVHNRLKYRQQAGIQVA